MKPPSDGAFVTKGHPAIRALLRLGWISAETVHDAKLKAPGWLCEWYLHFEHASWWGLDPVLIAVLVRLCTDPQAAHILNAFSRVHGHIDDVPRLLEIEPFEDVDLQLQKK